MGRMKFALDTFRDLAGDSRDRRIHAAFTLALWFALGGYLFSTLGVYFAPFETTLASVVGGMATAVLAAMVKLT